VPKSAELSKKLASSPSWKDTIAPGKSGKSAVEDQSTDSQKLIRKTYLLFAEDIERVLKLAEQERVGINELVRYLLNMGCDMIESGDHVLPTKTEEVRRIVS
jgi:hypothetical protein